MRLLQPLSRKEEEEMHRMQAKIERESRVRQAKTNRKNGGDMARPIFGLSDLLQNIDKHERAAGHDTKRRAFDSMMHDGNTSDPIQSSSDGEADASTISLSRNAAIRTARFTPSVKPLTPSPPHEKADVDDDEELPDVADMQKKLIEDRIKKSKYEDFKERKVQALLKSVAQVHAKDEEEMVDGDDILIEDTRKAEKAKQKQRKTNRMGSPSALSDGEIEDDEVTDAQLRRAGKSMNVTFNRSPSPQAVKRKKDLKSKAKGLSPEELNEALKQKVHLQNIEMRRKREAAFGRKKENQKIEATEEAKDDGVAEMLQKLREAHEKQAERASPEDDLSEGDAEFKPNGEEEEEEDLDLGSGEEDSDAEEEAEAGEEHDSSEAEDSEKENSMPASQEMMQPRIARRSRILLDEDDEEGASNPTPLNRSPLQPIVIVHEEENGDGRDMAEKERPILESMDDGSFSQFFAESQAPNGDSISRSSPSPQPAPAAAPRRLSSTLGKFFEDTQLNAPLRGESFNVLPSSDDAGAAGFSQFFNEDTRDSPEPMTSHLMLPPNTSARGLSLLGGTDNDGFAALRKAQAKEANVLENEHNALPSLDAAAGLQEEEILALELEAMEAEVAERRQQGKERGEEEEVTYLNKDGFFTQTKPDFERYSLSQSQSQGKAGLSRWGNSQLQGGSSMGEQYEGEQGGKKKRRFRRVISMEEGDQEASSFEPSKQNTDSLAEENVPVAPLMEEESAPLNAFDIMRSANQRSKSMEASPPRQAKRNLFIQGEAEESDEEDEGGPAGKKHKAGRGGLGGIFSDDESDDGGDEEDSEDDDERDLEELVDESKDEEEAEKDVLARERYFKDVEADDQAALALHEKAARGGMRSKRRAVGLDGTLEGFLDDDYEDEWLEKKVKNPYKFVAKKRRLQGLDGLDLLEANEESQAFVRKYREGHEKETDLDKYRFLLPDEDGEEGDEIASKKQKQVVSESDESNSDEEVEAISHQQLKKELEERRRKRKRQALGLSDDEEEQTKRDLEEEEAAKERRAAEEEALMMKRLQREIYAHSSDEEELDDEDVSIQGVASAHLRGNRHRENMMDVSEEEEENDDNAFSALNRVSNARTLSESERQRLAQLQSEYANEPEWGQQDGNQHIVRNTSGKGQSITSFKSSKSISAKGVASLDAGRANGRSRAPQRVRSKLSDVMSRRGQFSEVDND